MRWNIILLFILFYTELLANSKTDSLFALLNGASDDQKVELYYQLAHVYEETSDDTAWVYIQKATEQAKKMQHNLLPEIYKLTGYLNYKEGNLTKASENYNLALEGFIAQNNPMQQAQVFNNLAVIERSVGNIEKAEAYYLWASTIFLEQQADIELANQYLNLCYFYSNLGNYAKADYYVEIAIEIGRNNNDNQIISKANKYLAIKHLNANKFAEALNCQFQNVDLFTLSGNYTELAYTYFAIATIYRELGQFDQVIKYLDASLDLAKQTGSSNYASKTLNEMGYVYNQWNKPELAIDLFYQAIELEPNTEGMNMAHSLAGLGEVYEHIKVFKKAINYYEEAGKIFEKLSYKAGQVQVYTHLANLYSESLNNFKKADYYFKLANKVANELGDTDLLTELWLLEGNSLYKQAKLSDALACFQKVNNSDDGDHQMLLTSFINTAEIYTTLKKIELSTKFYKLALDYKDSVAKQKQIIEYNSWILKQNHQDLSITPVSLRINDDHKLLKNKYVTTVVIILFAVLLIIILVLWLSSRKKLQKLQKSLNSLTNELNHQKGLVSEMNLSLLDSKVKADKSNQYKTRFLANISHELRTPLNAILGYARLMARQNKDDIIHKYANSIISSSDSLHDLINNLLDFSKLESGQMRIEQQVFSPLSIITQIVSDNKSKASAKNIALELHIDPQIPDLVIGDPIRLVQMIDNVLDNAIKYSHEGKAVTFEVLNKELENDRAKITFNITDRGIGIEPDKLDSIFKSFSRLEKTPNKNDGAGLGLAVTKGLVELQDGKISVESQIDGPTSFKIEMQYPIVNEKNYNENKGEHPNVKSSKHIKILLVEDNAINCELAIDTIAFWGDSYSCEVAENGLEAIEKLKQTHFDVVLMDIQMPVMDGYTATRHIRVELPQPLCNIPIIGITAHAFEKEKQEALQNGMNAYLTKPFDPAELKQTVDDLLNI